jgi:hypothetical protein
MNKYYLALTFFILSVLKFDSSFASEKVIVYEKSFNSFPTDTLLNQLTSLNLSQFQGQKVDSLLAHLPGGYLSMKIGGWRSQRQAEVLYIIYPNKISVGIHVRNFQFMNPHLENTSTPTQNWDINLFRQETITFTIIYNKNICINGCENNYK